MARKSAVPKALPLRCNKDQECETNSNSLEAIVVTLRDQGGFETTYKIPKTTEFAKLMKHYADSKGADVRIFRFVHEGQRLNAGQTPEEMEVEDQDVIDVFLEQCGGGDVANEA